MKLTRQDAVASLSGQTLTLERLSVPGRLSLYLESRKSTRAAILSWLPSTCRRIWIPSDIYMKVLPHIPPKINVNRCDPIDDPKTHFNSVLDRYQEECLVCDKSLTKGEVTSYYCGHSFHDWCIHLWVCVSDRPSCPSCRSRITKEMCGQCCPC